MADVTNNPPVLYGEPDYIHETRAIGTYWTPYDNSSGTAGRIESNLDFLADFYQKQVEDRRWYGFLDFGDFMHTYDPDRHTWRYDIGGYAWDNSELSPDLFFWSHFLRTGRADLYHFSHDMSRHTGEVDVYHIGQWKGLGTRHGVQHFGDSAKQARISQAQFRKVFYFISGGDERTGELLEETLDTDKTYAILDPNRKVRTDGWVPTPGSLATIGLGTDWSALAASWLIEWERRGPRWEEAKTKLTNTLVGIASLKNGFVTGSGLYNSSDGTLAPPPTDPTNNGTVAVSHLSGAFGLMEVIAELTEQYGDDLPAGFEEVWLDYCYYYSAPAAEQISRYGSSWSASLRQDHSRLLAYAANRLNNATLAARAWSEFEVDGLNTTGVWEAVRLSGSEVLSEVDEATWISTNEAAVSAIVMVLCSLPPDNVTDIHARTMDSQRSSIWLTFLMQSRRVIHKQWQYCTGQTPLHKQHEAIIVILVTSPYAPHALLCCSASMDPLVSDRISSGFGFKFTHVVRSAVTPTVTMFSAVSELRKSLTCRSSPTSVSIGTPNFRASAGEEIVTDVFDSTVADL